MAASIDRRTHASCIYVVSPTLTFIPFLFDRFVCVVDVVCLFLLSENRSTDEPVCSYFRSSEGFMTTDGINGEGIILSTCRRTGPSEVVCSGCRVVEFSRPLHEISRFFCSSAVNSSKAEKPTSCLSDLLDDGQHFFTEEYYK